MLHTQQNYDFRKDMLEIHKKDLRDCSIKPSDDEFEIKDGMKIVIDENASEVILTAAKDFADYLYTSMGVSLFVKKGAPADGEIYVGTKNEIVADLKNADSYKGFMVEVADKITVCGFDDRGAAQGLYFLEDEMTEKRAPYPTKKITRRKPLFSPRMLHSGYALDEFPDEHLSAIAHAGRDAILVFTKGVNETPSGYLDFNELIHRAAKFGIDVYAYSYIKTLVHPEDPSAKAVYDGLYGKIFKECPGLKGITLVGESVEFASKDPRVCKPGGDWDSDEVPSGKPRPGWFPCYDFPQWIELVRDSVRKYKPDADIVFWTYNWGWAPKKERLELIENMPTDVSLLVTYEMFQKYKLENITEQCSDYTLVFEGPGEYFITEAEAAKKRGIKLYAMTNTGGLTWDMGTVPYEPMPYQWIKRYKGIVDANKKWGLVGLMESHHYGYYPSFIGELSNLALSDTEMSMEEHLNHILIKHFGKGNEAKVDEALKLWSDAITHFTPANEDQYGPFRCGPSFPLCLIRVVNVPCSEYAHFGNRIFFPDYPKYPANDQPGNTASTLRTPVEIRSLGKAKALLEDGVKILETIKNPNDNLLYLINLGKYMAAIVTTGIHLKQWYITKTKLLLEQDLDKIEELFVTLIEIAEAELKNAENTLPIVEVDSRLGWEPSMEYVGDKASIEWKIRQVKYVLEKEIPEYKQRFKN